LEGKAQDIHFSQYSNTPLLINPALAGEFKGNGRFMLNYRNQWRGVTNNPYKTYAFAFDRSFLKEKLSAGITAYRDQAGDANMGITQVNLMVATKVSVGRNDYLKLGINGAWSQQSIQISKLTWNSQFDGQIINQNISSGESFYDNSFNYVDISTGLLWSHLYHNESSLNIGLSAFHVSRPYYEFFSLTERLKIRWCGNLDLTIPWPEKQITIYPSFLIMVQGPNREVNIGGTVRYKFDVGSRYTGYYKASYGYLGAYYRYGDAIIVYARINYKNQFNLGISYDINISNLAAAPFAGGGLEISLFYLIPEKALIELK